MLSHSLHPYFTQRRQPVKIFVVGAGGTGSKTVIGLKNISQALRALSHPGLHVTLADGDTVSESNLVRQSFYPSDIGLYKAEVLINRLNLSCGLAWEAMPRHATAETIREERPNVVVSCVDSRKARSEIAEGVVGQGVVYALDAGNHATTGQVVMGCPSGFYNPRRRDRLRTAYELFPELCDASIPEDDAPSCSTLEALEKQDLLINDLAATCLLNLLWQLFRHGTIDHHGAFISLKTGSVRPIPVDPNLWRRLQRQGRKAKQLGTA